MITTHKTNIEIEINSNVMLKLNLFKGYID